MKKLSIKDKIFFKKSKLRKKVLDSLTEPKTATEIAKEIGVHRSSISRVLLDLEEQGFVKCINPEDKNYRHYAKK
ncbi:hypothetical protein COU62_01845 [Candidatus Pacearchaeota archaeon CG10_big_fil_rev_8_21_14_0_10_35_219]|nr:MAG: hypothetical protein COU62_01845 [Candidatus Pacearchaeota archaeon CG10_big_fil_rev_8_21_14_0_10_35_219]